MMKNDIKTWVHYSVLQMTDTEKKSNHEIKKSDDEQQLLKIMDQFIKMSEMIGAGDQVKNRTLVEKLFVHNMKQPFPMEHNFVEVKDSKLGGRGVFATDDIKKAKSSLEERGFNMPDISSGEGTNSSDQQVRRWKNLFLPPELSRGLFSFIIELKHFAQFVNIHQCCFCH